VLPSSLFKGESLSHSLAVLANNVRASLHSGVQKVLGRLLMLDPEVLLGVVEVLAHGHQSGHRSSCLGTASLTSVGAADSRLGALGHRLDMFSLHRASVGYGVRVHF
jgi:hypothetical protein